jgi:outer membrane protein OmpA-like peptidoglycan-associated protein
VLDRIPWVSSRALFPLLVLLLLLATFALSPTVRGQGLQVGGGYTHVSGNNGTDGFDVRGAWFFTKRVSIAADYDSTWDSTTLGTFTFTDTGAIGVDSHLQNVLFGPRIFFATKWTDKHRLRPFGEAQFGVSHLNQKVTLQNQPSVSASDTAFSWLLGGGVDYRLTSHFSARGNLDFLRTHFANQGQSHLRLVLGIDYTFRAQTGATPPPTPNRPPSASCSANPTTVYAGSGESVAVRADANDPDNDTLTYAWTATAGTVEGTGPQVRWNSAGLTVGAYSVTTRVDDGRGGTTTCAVDIHVSPRPNHPPTISCSVSPSTVHPGDRVHIVATASDPDSDPLTFVWHSSVGQITGSGAEVDLDTTGVSPSRYEVTGQVDDGRGGTGNCQVEFNLETPPPPAVEAKLAIRSIYFPTGLPSRARPNTGLLESQQRTLTSLASDYKEYLASRPNAHLVLEGHADSRGPAESNQRVSERRVEATKRFLTGLGIPEANLETKSFGEEQAMTSEQVRELVVQHPNLSQEQKDKIMKNLRTVTLAQNRRVDITLSSTGQQSVRQFPFNAEDALTLLSSESRKKPAAKKKR